MAEVPTVEEICERVAHDRRYRLEKVIDFDKNGVDLDLGAIAAQMTEWDGLVADHLGLTKTEIHDIKEAYRDKPERQRRAALQKWKQKYSSTATYRNLIISFHNAGNYLYADVVVSVVSSGNSDSPLTSATVGVSPHNGRRVPRPAEFSDSLSPAELAEWLSRQLEEGGLQLEDTPRKNLIDEGINGHAFKALTADELRELGFRLGARKNILKIIDSLQQKPAGSLPEASNEKQHGDPTLTFHVLERELSNVVNWFGLGVKLGMDYSKLKKIEMDEKGNDAQKRAFIKLWLDTDTNRSWDKLCDALKHSDLGNLAVTLRKKYAHRKQ